MGILKTFSLSVVCGLSFAPPASSEPWLVTETAICAGRLSAELQHKWLTQDRDADETQAARDAMLSRLEALKGAHDAALLAVRIEAKHAHAALLQQASFSGNAAQARWAATQARRQAATCKRLVQGYLEANAS